MDTETLLRVIAVTLAAVLLISNFDYSGIVNYIKSIFKRTPKPAPAPEAENVSFLETVESWHVLRHNCEINGLKEAVEKVDEVFPLLNTED
jgi:hypothetical protein